VTRRRGWALVLVVDLLAGAAIAVGSLVSDFFESTLGLVLVFAGAVVIVTTVAYTHRRRGALK
jgi:hypothetical protein